MKSIILLFGLLWCYALAAQKKGDEYNTKIGIAGKVKIDKGIVTITKADKVIISIYTNTSPLTKTKLYLSAYWDTLDLKTGLVTTVLEFKNTSIIDYIDIDISFKFDKEVSFATIGGIGMAMISMSKENLSDDKKEYSFKARSIHSVDGIMLRTQSKDRLKIKMFGIDGILQ